MLSTRPVSSRGYAEGRLGNGCLTVCPVIIRNLTQAEVPFADGDLTGGYKTESV
jgi:hypothetical protein